MGIFVLICIAVGGVCFFNSWTFKSWMWHQREEEAREEEQRQKQKEDQELQKNARSFCDSIVRYDWVKSMANKILEILMNMMIQEVSTSQENVSEYQIRLEVKHWGIQKQWFDYRYNLYSPDYNDKSGLSFHFTDFGIQMSDDPYKVYGLALALEALISAQELSAPKEVENFRICTIVDKPLDSYEIVLSLSYTIRQNKFIEL